MATATKGKWEVGQRLWWDESPYDIIKIGRKWLTVKAPDSAWRTHQVDIDNLRVNSDYGGVMHEDHEVWLERRAASDAWHAFRLAVNAGCGTPPNITAESVHRAAAIIGLSLEEKKRK